MTETLERQQCPTWRSSLAAKWPVWLVAGLTLTNGLAAIFLGLARFRFFPRSLGLIPPFGVHYWTRSLTLFFGIVLVYLAFNLFGRRRAAFWLTLLATAAVGLVYIIRVHFWYLSLPSAAIVTLMVIYRKRFFVRSEPGGIPRGLLILALGLAITVAYGVLGFWLMDHRDFGIVFSFGDALLRTLKQLVLIGNSDLLPRTRFARWFLSSLSILGPLSLGLGLLSLFRPVAYRYSLRPRETALAERILHDYGRGSYDYFKVWQDKSYYFNEDRSAFISYRTAQGVAVVLGDPLGPGEKLPALVESFLGYCAQNAWLAVFMLPEQVEMYRKACLSVLRVGEEGIIDIDRFAKETSVNKYFRHVVRAMEGEGFQARLLTPPLTPQRLDELQAVTKRWLTLAQHREYGFYQGTFSREYISKNPVFVVTDKNDRIVAFINQVPSYKPGEATFDMMRHLPGTLNPTMDYLFRFTMLTLQQQGFHTFDMGMVPFVGSDIPRNTRLGQRAMKEIGQVTNWLVHSEGLRGYKLKFEPEWEPRYIAYTGSPLGLARIGLAAVRVL
jgi:phosphatidylglycerol lysyltransferase